MTQLSQGGRRALSCAASANWLRRRISHPLKCGKPRHDRARTAATQPLSGGTRSRQALCLVPLRAKPEAALLRRVACRDRHRAVDVHRGAHRSLPFFAAARIPAIHPTATARICCCNIGHASIMRFTLYAPRPYCYEGAPRGRGHRHGADTLAPGRGEGGQRRQWLTSCNS